MKSLSSGVIITDGDKILMGHATNMSHWDIPKGMVKHGEAVLDACLRETEEETGLKLNPDELEDLGVFKYNKKKNLHVFRISTNLPPLEYLKCNSFFDKDGEQIPELDRFKYVSISDVKKHAPKSLCRVLSLIYNL